MKQVKKKYIPFSAFVFLILFLVSSSCTHQLVRKNSVERTFHLPNSSVPIGFSAFETGFAYIPEALMIKGGNLFQKKRITYSVFIVNHPEGVLLFDTGLGDSIDHHFQNNMNFLSKQFFKYQKNRTFSKQLLDSTLSKDKPMGIVMSHLHWDHAGGIEDFGSVSVWIDEEEYEYGHWHRHGKNSPYISTMYNGKNINWQFLTFNDGPYEVFSQCNDFFGDGTVMMVKLPGHSPGSVGMFVNISPEKRYFLIGDLAWNNAAISENKTRPLLVEKKVDFDAKLLAKSLELVHQLKKACPEIVVVPSHDWSVVQNIKQFPDFEMGEWQNNDFN